MTDRLWQDKHTHIYGPNAGSGSNIENTVEFRGLNRSREDFPLEGKLPQVML